MHTCHLPLRPGIGIILFNKDANVFAGKRSDMTSPYWQMPQGGRKENESPETTVFRELQEELGTSKATIISQSQQVHRYYLPQELASQFWQGQYAGQEQLWFLLHFTGSDADINIATQEPEFSSWEWKALASMPDLAIPFKRDLYKALVIEFTPIIKDYMIKCRR